MGILDRDYMRRDCDDEQYDGRRWSLTKIAAGVAAVATILSTIIWLFSFLPTGSDTIEKGSLRVNINTATIEELQSLPGIGMSRANLIVAHRPYESVDSLGKVNGIHRKLLNDIRPYLTVREPTARIQSVK
jgi:competence ComEA-like helix-hairpin-helix protein